MSVTARTWQTPRRILLASDLSSSCDRALDRAVQLTGEWDARLTLLHVMDPAESFIDAMDRGEPSGRRPHDRTELVTRQLRDGLPATAGPVEVLIDEGDPATSIDRVARERAAELIVTGVARTETLGRMLLGTTVSKLVRRTSVPLLVVRGRARPYGRVLVATDFSDSSRHALRAALAFFPGAQIELLHAFDAPFLHTGDDLGASFLKLAHEGATQFIAEPSLPPGERRRVAIRIEQGPLTAAVERRLVADEDIRLVVIGSHGHSAVFDVLIGSTARRVLETAPCDVLLVREPRAVDIR